MRRVKKSACRSSFTVYERVMLAKLKAGRCRRYGRAMRVAQSHKL